MTPPTEERRAELRATWEGHPLLDWVDALEAALRPFGDCAWDGGQDDGVAILRRDGTELTVGDFRRAASLLPGEGNA